MKLLTYTVSGIGEYSKYRLKCKYITKFDEIPPISVLMNHVDSHAILYGDWYNYSITDIKLENIKLEDLIDYINTEFEPVKYI